MDNQMNGNTRQSANHEVIIAILHTIETAINAIRDVLIEFRRTKESYHD